MSLISGAALRRLLVSIAIPLSLSGCVGTVLGPSPSALSTSSQRVLKLTQELKKRPEDVSTLRDIGHEYANIGSWNESLGAYREALIVSPNDREAILGFARAQLATGNFSGALAHAEKGLAQKVDGKALALKGGALIGLGRLADARAVLGQAVASQPRDLDLRNDLALAEALAGESSAYGLAQSVAFAPDADIRHMRNMVLVGGIVGMEAQARRDAGLLGISDADTKAILAISAKARKQGISAFGVAPMTGS